MSQSLIPFLSLLRLQTRLTLQVHTTKGLSKKPQYKVRTQNGTTVCL